MIASRAIMADDGTDVLAADASTSTPTSSSSISNPMTPKKTVRITSKTSTGGGSSMQWLLTLVTGGLPPTHSAYASSFSTV